MVDAVIWDFGGVLTSSPFEAFARFERERGLPADIIRRTNAENHLENAWAKFERAEVDLDAFDELFAVESKALGAEVRGKDVVTLLSGDLRPEMVEALKRIGENFKTGCITNNLPANAIGSHSGRKLYVAEVGQKRVVAIHPASGSKTVIASNLDIGLPSYAGGPPALVVTGVAVSRSGAVYVSADTRNALYKLTPPAAQP